MKIHLPEYLLCEDPTADKENLFIYHTPSKALIHILHTDSITKNKAEILYMNRKHFDYTYTNNQGKTQKIMFVAELVDASAKIEQVILERCAHWYACYLGWEEDCDEVQHQLS